jgi:hypothetical protein
MNISLKKSQKQTGAVHVIPFAPHINVDVLLMDFGCVRSEYRFVGFFWICEIDVV